MRWFLFVSERFLSEMSSDTWFKFITRFSLSKQQSQKQLTDEELDEHIEEAAGVDGYIDADEVPILR